MVAVNLPLMAFLENPCVTTEVETEVEAEAGGLSINSFFL